MWRKRCRSCGASLAFFWFLLQRFRSYGASGRLHKRVFISYSRFVRAGMVKHSETLASKFLASLRVPPFVDTQVHMAGKVFNHSRPTIFLRSFAHFSGQKVGTRLVVPLLGALVFLIFLFGFGICLGCRSLGFRVSLNAVLNLRILATRGFNILLICNWIRRR